MHPSKIEWVRNPDNKTLGWVWNPVTGCLNHDECGNCYSGGFPCYAWRLANGRLRSRYLDNDNVAPFFNSPLTPNYNGQDMDARIVDPFYPRYWPSRITEPLEIKKPSGIFIVDMGDLFGDWVPIEWQNIILRVIEQCPQHRFYLLTKQPQNLFHWSPFPKNCWVGITMTKPDSVAMEELDKVEAPVRFVSMEPMLDRCPGISFEELPVEWVIIGAQSNPYKPPKAEWVQEVVEAADKEVMPVFLKDNLRQHIRRYPEKVNKWAWAGIHFRQEMPYA